MNFEYLTKSFLYVQNGSFTSKELSFNFANLALEGMENFKRKVRGVILNEKGQMLFMKSENGSYMLPGGTIEKKKKKKLIEEGKNIEEEDETFLLKVEPEYELKELSRELQEEADIKDVTFVYPAMYRITFHQRDLVINHPKTPCGKTENRVTDASIYLGYTKDEFGKGTLTPKEQELGLKPEWVNLMDVPEVVGFSREGIQDIIQATKMDTEEAIDITREESFKIEIAYACFWLWERIKENRRNQEKVKDQKDIEEEIL